MATPRILCDDPQIMLQSTLPQLYERLSSSLTQSIMEDDNIHTGLSSKLSGDIFNFLYEEFSKLTKYKYREWCEISSNNVIKYINLVITGLIVINKLKELTKDEMVRLLYHVIISQLHDENKEDGLLDSIYYYDSVNDLNDSSDIDKISSCSSDSDSSDSDKLSNSSSDLE
jgi:hypothetical protein